MMKRAKTIICIILSLVMLALVGCSQDINGDNRTKKLLVDFENVSSVEYVNFNNDDGKTMFSKEHATRGTYCLHYVIEEDEYRDGASYPAIDLSVSGMNIANVDEIDYFALDIYSAKAQDVYLSLAFYDEKGKTVYSDVTKVKANVQTEARFYVDFDEQTVLSKAKIVFYQEGVHEDGLDVYLDNLCVVSGKDNKFDKVLSFGEILSFKSYDDTKFVSWEGVTENSTVLKGYDDQALVLEQFPHSGIDGKPLSEITPEQQKFSIAFDKEVFDRTDFTSVQFVAFEICNEGFKSRDVRVWYEIDGKKVYQSIILNANSWQTVKLKTSNKAIERIGIEFNSADITEMTRTLIRSVRYVL